MTSKNVCFCIPSLKHKKSKDDSEELSSKPRSASQSKSHGSGKGRRNVTKDSVDNVEATGHGAAGATNTGSIDAGAAVVVMSTMGGSECGSSHGGGGGGDGGGGG